MPFPERIETERLLLRWPTEANAPEMFARFASDPDVTHYLSWSPHESADETLANLKERLKNESLANWLIYPRAGGALLGSIGCHRDKHIVQFGYCLARDCWGRGYATEAARAAVETWLADPTVWRVHAYCDPTNTASAKVLEKAGLVYEGLIRRYALTPAVSDEPCDAMLFARIRI